MVWDKMKNAQMNRIVGIILIVAILIVILFMIFKGKKSIPDLPFA